MKRPQSAKPGYRAPIHSSTDEIKQEDIHSRNNRKPVKLLKPDLTTNDFARVMPKKIYQDKQRLYSEGLQLKQKLNETQQENIRLKTRISILEKEKDKLSKVIDKAADSSNTSQGRFKMYQGPSNSTDKENMMVRNLKKMIRDTKQENDYLKQENAKIKKAVKFTKINEVEIQCKILRDQYQKLKQVLIELNDKLADQEQYEKQIQQLKSYLEQQVQQNKELTESNQKFAEYIQQLQQKIGKEGQKAQQKQKRLQRQLALAKRRLNQQIKCADDLRKQIKNLKQIPSKNLNVKKKQFPNRIIQRPSTANPNVKEIQKKQPNVNAEAQKKLQQLKQKNEKLEQQLKQMKKKLQQSKKPASPDKKRQKLHQDSGQKQLRLDSQPKEDTNKQTNQQFIMSQQKSNKKQKQKPQQQHNFLLKQQTKIEKQEEYADEFESGGQQKQTSHKKIQNKIDSKKGADSHMEDYYKDFQQEGVEQQELYKKDTKKQTKTQTKKQKKDSKEGKESKEAKKKQKQSSNKDNVKGYQPNKQILSEIKQLLTYRMKAQRYPYEQLQKDIQASKEAQFSHGDLEGMLKAQPFYLTPNYTKQMLEYIYEKKGTLNAKQTVLTTTLLAKLRKVIKDFQLPDEKEEQEHLMSIAEMTTQYPQQLENQFQRIKNGNDTVAKKDLVQMFKKLELADHFIEIIISELSLCSTDLEHLNIRGYFDRFYIQDLENSDEYAINEQNGQSSGQNVAKHKSKIPKIDQQDEYQDDKANFILEDEGELSMRGKQPLQQDYGDNMISDDDHV